MSFIISCCFNKNVSPLQDLPHVMPIFFVPPLEDVPQNPIMDNLKIEEANLNLPKRLTRTKNLVESDAKDAHEATRAWSLEEDNRKELKAETLWAEAAKPKVGFSVSTLSAAFYGLSIPS